MPDFRFTISITPRPGALPQTSFTNSSNGCYQIATWALNARVDTLRINGKWCVGMYDVEQEVRKVCEASRKNNTVAKELI